MPMRRERPGRRPHTSGGVPGAIRVGARTLPEQRRAFCASRLGCSGTRRCTGRPTPTTGPPARRTVGSQVHARRCPAATRRPSACCSRPGGRRVQRPPGVQPGDVDRRRRGLARGSAPCGPGGRCQASRLAPSRGGREHRSGSRLAEARVRASDVARMDFPAGLTVNRPAPPERQTPRRTPRLRAAARRARPPPS